MYICVFSCTQLVAIASEFTDFAFHIYHVMTIRLRCLELSMCTCSFALHYLNPYIQNNRETALHAACKHGQIDVATLVLQRGAEVDTQDEVRLLGYLYKLESCNEIKME